MSGLRRFCSCSVLVYGSVDTAAQCLLTLHNPEGCPVLCLKQSSRYLFAGLWNGTVMVYGRSDSGKVPPRLSVCLFIYSVQTAADFLILLVSCCSQWGGCKTMKRFFKNVLLLSLCVGFYQCKTQKPCCVFADMVTSLLSAMSSFIFRDDQQMDCFLR